MICSAELAKLQIRQSELELTAQHLDEHVQERYRLDIRRVAGDYHLRPPLTDKHRKRIEELKDLISRMGEINLTAIDEYSELSERHTFLAGQRDDLESALNQLARAIQKINRTMPPTLCRNL